MAVKPGAGPDIEERVGQQVDLHDNFALQSCPTMKKLDMPLFLTGGQGPMTQDKRTEVWTADFHCRQAFEDAPLDGRWPSYEFHASRKPLVDESDAVRLIEEEHDEAVERGRALAVAARDEDLMMQSFMLMSGVPPTVTEEQDRPGAYRP